MAGSDKPQAAKGANDEAGSGADAGSAAEAASSARSAMRDAADAWRNLGKQMREEFRAGAKDATARAMNVATDAAQRASESTNGASTRINDAAIEAMNAAGEAMDKAYDAANEAADKAYEAAGKTADAAADAAGKAAKAAAETSGDFVEKAGKAAAQAAEAAGKTAEAAADAAAKATSDLLDQAQKSAADWQDKFMRLHAEWDTYRRRTAEDRLQEKERANENLMKDLLPVLDDFERTIAYANENGVDQLLEGVEAVQSKLLNVLTSDGLEPVDPKDEAFDALEHQAVGTVENPDVPDETVAQVYQKGYKMGGKVLRPAMVQVTTGGPQRPKEDKDAKEDK